MDAPTLVTACAGTLGPLGAAGAFIWRKIERRIDGLETKLNQCEQQHGVAKSLADRFLLGMQTLADEVQALNPASPALVLVQRILGEAYRLQPTPPDMLKTMEKIA